MKLIFGSRAPRVAFIGTREELEAFEREMQIAAREKEARES